MFIVVNTVVRDVINDNISAPQDTTIHMPDTDAPVYTAPPATADEQLFGRLVVIMLVFAAIIIAIMVVAYFLILRLLGRERSNILRQQQIYDANPIISSLWDADLKILDCNEAMVQLLELSGKEDYINRFFDFAPPNQADGTPSALYLTNAIEQARLAGRCSFSWIHKTARGELIPGEVTFVRINYGRSHMFAAFMIDLRDITAALERQHELELQLREQEVNELNQVLLDSSPYVIGMWDDKGNLLSGNEKQTKEFFKIDDAQLVAKDLYSFSPEFQPCGTPTPQKAAMYAKQAYREGYARFEWVHKMPDGEIVPVEVIYKTYRYNGKNLMFSYTLDMRETKRLEAERLEAVQESNRAKSRFLARMSHEIRTPITAVLGISVMQLRRQSMPPHTEEAFTKIYDASKTLLHLVNDILDLSRIESGKMTIVPGVYNVAALVSDAAQMHLVYAEQSEVSFHVHVDENLPAKLIGDILRIRQIITNLLANAFKFTESGKVTFSLACDDTQDGSTVLVVCITDTGVGMSAEQLAQADEGYMRFHEQNKPYITGTGLGLPIAHSLAQAMDAQLELTSRVGEGSHVVVRIPQKIYGTEVLGAELAVRLQNFEIGGWSEANGLGFKPTQLPHGRVLVVDDVDTNLYVAEAMLEAFGLSIELCMSGEEAV
jgi:signal transduction histidine kinase